jgi:glyoxylase-like metal-dependent hydrolase (beta-lactamase superfamily II)
MDGRRLGSLTINRIFEMHSRFDALWFFPESTLEDWRAVESWLAPTGFDPVTRELIFPIQSYLVRTTHHTIVIDTCVGNHKDRDFDATWHQRDDAAYLNGLARLGVAPEEVDYVMCTHLHADHVGWNTRLEDGRWVPTFPNAQYIFSATELKTWERLLERHPNSALVDSVLPVVAAGQAQLVRNDFALDDEVWLESTPGHTPDHVAVRLGSQGHDAVMTGDLIHTPVQCHHPNWMVRPDYDKPLAAHTRRMFLERYADTSTLVCTMHFPLPSVGRLVSKADQFEFMPEASDW